MYTFIIKDGKLLQKQINYNKNEIGDEYNQDTEYNSEEDIKVKKSDISYMKLNCLFNILVFSLLFMSFVFILLKWKHKNVDEFGFGYKFY